MDRIICLVGESGSGKSTIAEELEKKGYNYIQSYTTRPPRYEGEKGHIFVDDMEQGEKARDNILGCCLKEVIAYTFFDGHHYWATMGQYKGDGISIYVIDPVGVKDLKDRLWNASIDGDVDILAIYLKADDYVRWNRMCWRKYKSKDVADPEITDRLLHDKEKFKVVECNYVVDANRDVAAVLKDVIEIIEQ